MSIPLDRLYHYINNVAKEIHGDNVIIYRFFPHGSKNINDLSPLEPFASWLDSNLYPQIFCNDQEPLNFAAYQEPAHHVEDELAPLLDRHCNLPNLNMRGRLVNLFDRAVILHSEKNSKQVDLYASAGYVPAYYWSHALIARDWFRYAQHVDQTKVSDTTFLIYNRAWAGTREYRLKLADLLIENNLVSHCRTWANSCDINLGLHYSQHTFDNDQWRPQHRLENYFDPSSANSEYSADFDLSDYEATQIEVVLETLFDDDRIHLTEKTLRPIALGQPFILAGTAHSLQYLRAYGFKTYSEIWDESYDSIIDPAQRMTKILAVMKQISSWSKHENETKLAQAQKISDHNKKHFFSQDFLDLVTSELKNNLSDALNTVVKTNTGQSWINQVQQLQSCEAIVQMFENPKHELDPTSAMIDLVTNKAKFCQQFR